jgi:hypothetical protein
MLMILPGAGGQQLSREALAEAEEHRLRLVSSTSLQSVLGELEQVGPADDAGVVDEDVGAGRK